MKNHWLKSGWGYAPKSVDELMRLIIRINTLEAGKRFVWRGVHQASWKIDSSLQRKLETAPEYYSCKELQSDPDRLRSPERRILESARAWGVGLFPSGIMSDLQLLAILQHHGAPTRLIDVTPDPMTALWFACMDERLPRSGKDSTQRGHAGVLFAFNVTDFEIVRSIDPPRGLRGSWHDQLAAGLEVALMESLKSRAPLLLKPAAPDARMTAQQGLFLFGVEGAPSADFDSIRAFPLPLREPPGPDAWSRLAAPGDRLKGRPKRIEFACIVISPRLKRRTLDTLAGYNKTNASLFPDLGGFVDSITACTPGALVPQDQVYTNDVKSGDA